MKYKIIMTTKEKAAAYELGLMRKPTLREWQEILANNPELMKQFEAMTPAKPIE